MIIRSIRHRGLQRLIEDDNSRYLPGTMVSRIRNILAVLVLSENIDALINGAPPGWRIHSLSGERQGQWSVSVSGNWRVTFSESEGFVDSLNLEDYH